MSNENKIDLTGLELLLMLLLLIQCNICLRVDNISDNTKKSISSPDTVFIDANEWGEKPND
jgi:hypothetical protein